MPLSNISPDELVFLASAIAAYIADGMSDEELELFSALFTSIGDNLALILAKQVYDAALRGGDTGEELPSQ